MRGLGLGCLRCENGLLRPAIHKMAVGLTGCRVQSRLNVLGGPAGRQADGAPVIPVAHVEGWGPQYFVPANPARHT